MILSMMCGGWIMNESEYLSWVDCVQSHMDLLDELVEDRISLKKKLKNHLSQFFNFEEIEVSRDFSKVTFWVEDMFIDCEKLSGLLMPWRIEAYYDEDKTQVIVYPFGVPNEDGDS